jgi:hypothetical protein
LRGVKCPTDFVKILALKIFPVRSGKIPEAIGVFPREKERIRPFFLFPGGSPDSRGCAESRVSGSEAEGGAEIEACGIHQCSIPNGQPSPGEVSLVG